MIRIITKAHGTHTVEEVLPVNPDLRYVKHVGVDTLIAIYGAESLTNVSGTDVTDLIVDGRTYTDEAEIDDDGYMVWPVSSLPGLVRVQEVAA